MYQKLKAWKGETDILLKGQITVGDFNTPLLIMARTTKQKIDLDLKFGFFISDSF